MLLTNLKFRKKGKATEIAEDNEAGLTRDVLAFLLNYRSSMNL